jgi:dethiobiotin synthetase
LQAGLNPETDSEFVQKILHDTDSIIFPEVYKIKLAASPHIAARQEGITINLEKIANQRPSTHSLLIIEGAGGIMVPLNEEEFVIDLIEKLDAMVILVSRNYLGSINHSLLTASICRQRNLDVKGWIFSGDYGGYADDIARWTGYPVIGKIPELSSINQEVLSHHAESLKPGLLKFLHHS